MKRLFLLPFLAAMLVAAKPAPPPVAPAPPPAPVDPLGPMPDVQGEVSVSVPTPVDSKLSNGADLWVLEKHDLPLVSVRVTVPGGSSLDAKGKEGTASLSDQLLREGAGSHDATSFAELVARMGIQLDVSTGHSSSTITMSMKRDQLDLALDLLADMVLRPKFANKDFKREKGLELASLQQDLNEPVSVASHVAWFHWFGDGHPYANPDGGTVKGMGGVARGDVQAYHEKAWTPGGATITVVGDIAAADAHTALELRLGKPWPTAPAATVNVPPAPAHDKAPILLVDRPGSAQTMFYLVFPGIPFGDPGTPALRTGTIAFGGTFTSRLNQLLREKEGFTYGASAKMVQLPKAGMLTIGTRIISDKTGLAMVDIQKELAMLKDGFTEDEVTKARGSWKQEQVESLESLEGTAELYGMYHDFGRSPGALADEIRAMQDVTKDRMDQSAKLWDPGQAVIVLVGDRKLVTAQLQDAGQVGAPQLVDGM